MVATAADAGARSGNSRAAQASSARRIASAVAGPALVLASVLFALRGFAFHPLLTNAHPDILSFWLPRYAFLGRNLAAGHIPLWNPFEMAGYRFAADPQSGWLYAPAMLLFSTLSPGAALRTLIVFNPALEGLGLYAFLRKVGLARSTATAGALSAAMIVATSWIAISLPFAGTLAWTPIVLLGAAGYRHADRWSRRLLWLALAAFAWSQVANAHMSHGLVTCTLLVASYLVTGALLDVRRHEVDVRTALARAALFLLAMPLASLPVLIPRLAFIRSSSLHAGYLGVADVGKGTSAGQEAPLAGGMWPGWPLALGSAPGPYAGAAILLAVPLVLRARGWRHLACAFGAALALGYVATVDLLVNASWFQRAMLAVPFGDVYVHNAGRFRYVAVVAIPVIGAVGLQGLLDDPPSERTALRWLGAGLFVWLGLPLAFGAAPARLVLLAAGAAAAIPLLAFVGRRRAPKAIVAVAVLLGCELVASAFWSQHTSLYDASARLSLGGQTDLLAPSLPWPDVSETAFLEPTPFVRSLTGTSDRYLTWAPPASDYDKGYLFAQARQDWPALVMERGTLYGIHDVLGYNPVQLPRYWAFIRATNRLPVFYNASVISLPTLEDVRLLGVRYLIVPSGVPPPLATTSLLATDRGYDLWEVAGWESRVSVVSSWSVVSSPAEALGDALAPGFDPAATALLEPPPGTGVPATAAPTSPTTGTATYRESTPEDVSINVDAPSPSIVVVRTVFDPGWSATVDGRIAPVIPTDSLLQGVLVNAGHHEIRLTYHDGAVTTGLLSGAVVWLALLAAIAAAAVLERRRPAVTIRGRVGGAPPR
jgi:hypothetical protein